MQQTRLPMHIPSRSLPCLLCSALLYHPLSSPLCLSLTPAETLLSAECGGMGAQAPAPSLSHPANIELRRRGKREKKNQTLSSRERMHEQFQSLPTIRKLEHLFFPSQSNEADFFFLACTKRAGCVRTALSRVRMVNEKCVFVCEAVFVRNEVEIHEKSYEAFTDRFGFD